jgi:hypothetical protein
MRFRRPLFMFPGGWLLAIVSVLIAAPVFANSANFGKISLSPGFEPGKALSTGYTGGSYSLSAISNRDAEKNPCIGFADPNPDHILVLEQNFASLKILINTGGSDTTLLVQGPNDGSILCGDDTGSSKDASVENSNWKAGVYKIWVGTFNPGVKKNYSLSIQQP